MSLEFFDTATLPSLDKVPDQFKPLFAKDEATGTFKIADDPKVKGAVEAIVGLNRSLKAARAEAQGLKGKAVDLAALSDYGASVEEIAAGVKAKVEELTGQLAEKGKVKIDLDKMKSELAAAHTKEKAGLETRIKSLTDQLTVILVDNAIRQAIGDQAIDPDLLIPFVRKHVATVEDGGMFRVHVIDEQGNQRINGGTGQDMSIPELVKDMKAATKYAPLFKSEAPRGGGAPPGGSTGRVQRDSGSTLSPTEKIKRALDKRVI